VDNRTEEGRRLKRAVEKDEIIQVEFYRRGGEEAL
jgi:hypothetical protein